MRLVLIGPPGAGKGTQGERIVDQYDFNLVSTGNILRNAMTQPSVEGEKISHMIKHGQLVPDAIVIKLVQKYINEISLDLHSSNFLFDGFPRNREQAIEMQKEEIEPHLAINLMISDDTLIQRLSGRLIHPNSGRAYHLLFHPPQKIGVDDITGEPLIRRDDDKPEVIAHRLQIYRKKIQPLLNFYQNSKVPLFNIDASQEINIISKEIYYLVEQHLSS